MTDSSFDNTLSNLGIGTYGNTTPSTETAAQAQTLTQADFLQLMTAQMQNQDPLNPVDDTQMASQMAQFSTVQGVSDMNTTLTSIADKLGGTSTSDALSYVGKNVLVAGSTAYPNTSGGIQGAVQLGNDASDVNVSISDASGNIVKTMALGAQSAGNVTFNWDGTTDSGASAGSGPFTISTYAQDNGVTVSSQPLVWAPVAAVSMPSNGDAQLTLPGLGQVPVSDVVEVG